MKELLISVACYLLNMLKSLILVILVFLVPAKGFIIAVTLAVALDTAVGIYTAIKLGGRKSYQSTKLFNIAVKTFFYTSSVCLLYVLDYFVVAGTIFGIILPLTKAGTIFFMYIEAKSMDEKSQKLGNPPFFVIVKNAIKKLKELKKDLNEIKKDE